MVNLDSSLKSSSTIIDEENKVKRVSQKIRQKGLSLIEVSMVLALAAVVVSGVMFYYQSANQSNRMETSVRQLNSMVGAVTSVYAGRPNFSGISMADIIYSSAIPQAMKNIDNGDPKKSTANLPLDPSTLVSIGIDSTNSRRWELKTVGIPRWACAQLAGLTFGDNVVSVKSNSVAFNYIGTNDEKNSIANVATECSKSDSGELVYTLR